jgi:peptidoglycan/LPS O-acetylase OafA/YrhL
MPELDTLRGIAVLLVVLFHAFGMSSRNAWISGPAKWLLHITDGGWIGVNLFFVLSGFLITGILVETRERRDYYRRFYSRRALRILPAYYMTLLLLLAVTRAGFVDRHASWSFLGLSFIFLANVTGLLGVPSQYTVLWSLAVEEHFYLLWPAVVKRLSRRSLPFLAVTIIVLCPLLRAFYYGHGYEYGAGYTWLVADGLACGALLALCARGILASRVRMLRSATALMVFSIATFAAGSPFGIYLSRTLAGGIFRVTLLNTFFTGMLGMTLVLGSGSFAWLVRIRVLKFFGDISYGLYLIHMLVFDLVDSSLSRFAVALDPALWLLLRGVIGITLSAAIAYLSRWTFEEPFLRLKATPSQPKTQVLVAANPVELAS